MLGKLSGTLRMVQCKAKTSNKTKTKGKICLSRRGVPNLVPQGLNAAWMLPLCNCWKGWEGLSDWDGVACFKASVEGLVNETSRSFYVPHVLQDHTHTHTLLPSLPHLPSVLCQYLLSRPWCFFSSTSLWLRRPSLKFLLCHPCSSSHRRLVTAHFSSIVSQMDRAEGESEGEWVTNSRASRSCWVACVQRLLANSKQQQPRDLAKLLPQPPAHHLALWFSSDAFYKHKPEDHGKQVSHKLGGSGRRFNIGADGPTSKTNSVALPGTPSRAFYLFSCQLLGTYRGKYWPRAG